MGQSKAMLPFGDELMLQRVVRIMSQVLDPIVVSAAAQQELPELPKNVIVMRDKQPELGPIQGIAIGLSELKGLVEAAFVSSCDVPFLSTNFIRHMIDLLGDNEIVVPFEERFHHPLAAVYRTSICSRADKLLAADQLRPFFLFEKSKTLKVPVEELREIDPELHSLMNLNSPEDYEAACRMINEIEQ